MVAPNGKGVTFCDIMFGIMLVCRSLELTHWRFKCGGRKRKYTRIAEEHYTSHSCKQFSLAVLQGNVNVPSLPIRRNIYYKFIIVEN